MPSDTKQLESQPASVPTVAARSTPPERATGDSKLRDLILELGRAADEAALRLKRARDQSISRKSTTLAMRSEALLLAHVLNRPLEEIESEARRLFAALVQLEFVATRSRLPIQDRAAITICRALASQVTCGLAGPATKATLQRVEDDSGAA